MNIRAMINVEIEKNDRTYIFSMPVGAPFGEAYDTAFEVCAKILELAAEEAAKNRAKTDSSKAEEKEAVAINS